MGAYIGNTEVGQMFLGSTEIGQAYLGSTKVWEKGGVTPPQPSLPYDAEIEFLECTGTQWIDTGSIGSESTDAYEIVFRPKSTANQMRFLSTSSTQEPNAVNLYRNGSGYFGFIYGGSWLNHGTTPGLIGTALHTWKCDLKSGINVIDGADYTITSAARNYTSTGNILFGGQFGSYPIFIGELHSLKKWTNDVLVINMVPVRVGQVGYMYDKVSGELFGNAGTGNFILGRDNAAQKSTITFASTDLAIGNRPPSKGLQLNSSGTTRACINREFSRSELDGITKITITNGYWCAISGLMVLNNTAAAGSYYDSGWLKSIENVVTLPEQWKFFSFNIRRADNGEMTSSDLTNIASNLSFVF